MRCVAILRSAPLVRNHWQGVAAALAAHLREGWIVVVEGMALRTGGYGFGARKVDVADWAGLRPRPLGTGRFGDLRASGFWTDWRFEGLEG